jgi:glycosyltransferase involved in cell wall biosynthesis
MNQKLNIAIIVPPFTNVPPKKQGGTERIAHQMIEGFSEKGYKVTLFGAGKYKGSARFIQVFKQTISERKINTTYIEASRSLRLETAYLTNVMTEIIKKEKEFDVVFNHSRGSYLFLPVSLFIKTPIVNILHLPIFKEMAEVISCYKKPNIVTISNSQRKNFSQINYLATVYNGVDIKEFKFSQKTKNYFLFMGSIGEHKNPKDAILAAQKANINLILAGGKKREPYFSKEIKPLIDGKQIKYLGEVSGEQRLKLFQEAKGFLMPIKWSEPFGLVMVEAMACGTPVIAYPNGAVEEIVKNKKTGFIVRNVKEMTEAIKKIDQIDRKECRKRVEENFSQEKMIDCYEKICYELINKNKK